MHICLRHYVALSLIDSLNVPPYLTQWPDNRLAEATTPLPHHGALMNFPDKEQIMSQVQQDAEQARDDLKSGEATARQAEPQRGLFAPIHMAPAHDGVPHEYILHVHTQLCSNCGCGEMHSEFFAYYRLRSRMGGNIVTHLRRADRPMYNLPVRRIPLTPTKVPFCSECENISLTHLPSPPAESNLTNLPEPTAKNAKPKAQAPKSTPTKATLEDLI